MKNKIRQILREETSGFDPKMLKVLNQFMNNLTKDYRWYTDTPEQRFDYAPESIWLINPKTEEWALYLKKDGWVWWYAGLYHSFKKFFNMEVLDYNKFVKLWVEDVLNRGASKSWWGDDEMIGQVEDVLNNGKELNNSKNDYDELDDIDLGALGLDLGL